MDKFLIVLSQAIRSKTVTAGTLVTLLGILADNTELINALIASPDVAGKVISGIGVLMIVLRYMTSLPVSAK